MKPKHLFCFVGIVLLSYGIGKWLAPIPESFQIGRGTIQHASWQPQGNRILVSTDNGWWLHDDHLNDIAQSSGARLARFSPNGFYIAAVTPDQRVEIWSVDPTQIIKSFEGHTASVIDLAWHTDGNLLATLDSSGVLIMWDLQTGQLHHRLITQGSDQIVWNTIYLAACDKESGTITIWTINGEPVIHLPHTFFSYYGARISWRDDHHLIRSLYDEGTYVDVIEATTGVITEHIGVGTSAGVLYSPDRDRYVNLNMFTTSVLTRQHEVIFTAGSGSYTAGWSASGRLLAIGTLHHPPTQSVGMIRVVDGQTGELHHEWSGSSHSTRVLDWNRDEQRLLVIDGTSAIKIYDIERGELIVQSDGYALVNGVVAWNSDGSRLAVADMLFNVRIYNQYGRVAATLRSHSEAITQIAWQPNGDLLAVHSGDFFYSTDHQVYIWNWHNPNAPARILPHDTHITGVAWSPDGSRLAVATRSHTITIWTVATGEAEFLEVFQYSTVTGVEWSPDGTMLAIASISSGNGGATTLWDVETHQSVEGSVGLWASNHIWTKDNRLLGVTWGYYGCGGAPAPIYEPSFYQGFPAVTTSFPVLYGLTAPVGYATISPNGSQVAGTDAENHLIVWDTETGQIQFQQNNRSFATWSPDGSVLVSANAENTILIDASTGDLLETWEGNFSVLWSPNHLRLTRIGQGMLEVIRWR
jgi:WD40 repeat protein